MGDFRGGKSRGSSRGGRGGSKSGARGGARSSSFDKPKRTKSSDDDHSKDYNYGVKKRDKKFGDKESNKLSKFKDGLQGKESGFKTRGTDKGGRGRGGSRAGSQIQRTD